VGVDEQGLEGIELALDKEIRGQGGQMEALLDARKQVFQFEYIQHPVPGKNIYLTIDTAVQFFVERALTRTLSALSAKGGSVIIMDTQTGEILAMASAPGYNPAELGRESRDRVRNRAVSFLYDPGSTFKMVAASAALEENVCYPQQVFDCAHGEMRYRGSVITDHKPYDKLTFEEVLIHSSNIGAARIALLLGRDRFYRAITAYGFGQKSGLPLSAEERGMLHPLNRWSDVSTAFLAFGYEILVTPIQMTQAYNVLANGGVFLPPQLISRIGEEPVRFGQARRVISESTRNRMVSILQDVVIKGTGKKAAIAGLDVAGKTGTAKKVVNGRYTRNYISSFGGFFPAHDPRVTIYVVIDEPQEIYYGGDVAAPLFREIAESVMVYLKLFPQRDEGGEIRL
jgi:cell division protein FtsI (penicillin-binding protein 3)